LSPCKLARTTSIAAAAASGHISEKAGVGIMRIIILKVIQRLLARSAGIRMVLHWGKVLPWLSE